MLQINYPHEKQNGFRERTKRILVLGAMGICVAEAAARNSFAITRRLLEKPLRQEPIKKRIKKIFKDLQEDPQHVTSIAYNRFSGINKFIKMNAATSHALERHYDYDEFVEEHGFDGALDRFSSDFWMRESYNSRGIRNRYSCVVQLLVDSMEGVICTQGEVRLFSLASGSAKAVLEAAKITHRNHPGSPISVLLVDVDPRALRKARKEVEAEAPFIRFCVKIGNVFRLDKTHGIITQFAPNIIEMVGFMDYIEHSEAPDILRQLCAYGPDYFLTCNVIPTVERIALHTVVMWPPMVYRSPTDLKKIMDRGGFSHAEMYVEPFGIHAIARWQKKSSVN